MLRKSCNVCGNSNVKFISIEDDFGSKLKSSHFPYDIDDFETLNYKEYACSRCGSSDRDRLYALYISKFFRTTKDIQLLDFAPSITLSEFIEQKPNITHRTADLYMQGVDDQVDICDMKIYENESFDFFICSHVLEHVKDDKKALSELYRILKIGGKGILMTPIIDKNGVFDEDINIKDEDIRWKRFAQGDHVRLYEKRIFIDRVNSAGFKIYQLTKTELGRLNFKRLGISKKSVLYIVEKS